MFVQDFCVSMLLCREREREGEREREWDREREREREGEREREDIYALIYKGMQQKKSTGKVYNDSMSIYKQNISVQ